MAEHYSSFFYNILPLSKIYLSKLQEQAIILDIHDAAILVSHNLHAKIEVTAKKKGIEKLPIDGQVIKTRVEPC